jgi:tripartite motif-containing protein 2/3
MPAPSVHLLNGNCSNAALRNRLNFRFGGHIGAADGQFNKPWGLCFDRSNNLIIADEGNSRIVMHRARDGARVACAFERVITTDVYVPKGVSINVHENVVVCDNNEHNFLKIFKYK